MSGNGIIISGNGGDTKPPRKFPPLCWSQEEALVLIQAYRDRWHALRRGCLRTADWDAVAEELGRICPGVTPPKTSAQCRHKMEKLRQRYRVEKQREMSFGGGQFVSNWFYFEAMEALERNDEIEVVGSGSGYSGSGYSGLNPGRGIRFKPNAAGVGLPLSNSNVRVPNSYVTQVEDNDNDNDGDNDEEFEDGYYETPINKNLGKTQGYAPRYRELEHLGARPRKVIKTGPNVNSGYGYWNGNEEERGSGYGSGRSLVGYSESEKRGVKRSNDDDDDVGEGEDPLGKLVSSIKVLADGFVKMEKMKMDMVREIETMRMEAEMKRNEMLLESQRQMVAAFVKGLAENPKK